MRALEYLTHGQKLPTVTLLPPYEKFGQGLLQLFCEGVEVGSGMAVKLVGALILPCVILWKDPPVKRAKDIKSRLDRHMDLWETGKIDELV